ncbi:MAG: D-hexose-6-phosphate mutarotase [Thiobacillaceae bacterium]
MKQPAHAYNDRFAQPGLVFRDDPSGLVFAEIDNAHATASVCLQGAHLVTWRPKDQVHPVVWVSEAARFAPGKSIRGGVPVCWPWFGPHAMEGAFPAHGFARTVPWQVTATETLDDGATCIALVLLQNEQTRVLFPHACRLELMLTVGIALDASLVSTNLDTEPLVIGEALHTYFQIGDIGQARVLGLDGCTYVDKVDGGARKRQDGPVTFAGETDRVYVDTEARCVIEDPVLGRRIVIDKSGSRSTVVWTPWQEKAEKMGDLGPNEGWRRMVCVESGNALDNVLRLAPGEAHVLSVSYRAEPL